MCRSYIYVLYVYQNMYELQYGCESDYIHAIHFATVSPYFFIWSVPNTDILCVEA